MRTVLTAILLFLSASMAVGQYVENYEFERQPTIIKFGVGIGLDYGVVGARMTITPVPQVGIFGALGYNINAIGYDLQKAAYNVGVNYKFLPDKRVTPVAGLMYGYNAIIAIENDRSDPYNKTYNGFSLSGGIELNMKKSKNYWSFELIASFWTREFRNDWDRLKNDPNYTSQEEVLIPIGISVGYHFNI